MGERTDYDLLRSRLQDDRDDVAPPRSGRRLWPVLLVLAALVGAVLVALGPGTGYAFAPVTDFEVPMAASLPADGAELRKLQAKLAKENRQHAATLAKLEPKGNYIVIDQTQNRLYLMNDGKVVHQAVCSAGSGIVLKDSTRGRKWVFDTPRGVFKVRNRIENPVWRKPDWAFIEEGKPIPRNPADRIEAGTLGEYALYLEDGYMIHGTLYERLLGRSVSHGCVRVGRDDLRVFWKGTQIGTPVYIF
jgi:L,D-transpeptidase YbiS